MYDMQEHQQVLCLSAALRRAGLDPGAQGFCCCEWIHLSAMLEFLASKARYKAKLLQVQREVERRRLPPEMQQKVLEYFELKHSDENVQDGPAIMTGLAPGLRLEVALPTVGQLLAKLPVLQSHPQLLQRVALLVERQVAPEGQLIAIPGTPHQQLLFITRGYADLYMVTDVGEVLIDTLVAGDSFGEASLLPVPSPDLIPGRLRSLWANSGFSGQYWPVLFSLRALSNCSLAVLNAEAFSKLVQEYDETQEQLQRWSEHHAAVLNALPQLEQLWSAAAVFNPMRDRPRSFAHPAAAASKSKHDNNTAAAATSAGDDVDKGGAWRRDVWGLMKGSKQGIEGDGLKGLGRKARLPTSLR